MVGWIILAVLVALVVLILLIPIGADVRYEEDGVVRISAKVAGIRLQLLPKKKKAPKPEKPEKEKEEKPQPEKPEKEKKAEEKAVPLPECGRDSGPAEDGTARVRPLRKKV